MFESWSITHVVRRARADYRASPNKWYFWLAVALGIFALLLQGSFTSEYGVP